MLKVQRKCCSGRGVASRQDTGYWFECRIHIEFKSLLHQVSKDFVSLVRDDSNELEAAAEHCLDEGESALREQRSAQRLSALASARQHARGPLGLHGHQLKRLVPPIHFVRVLHAASFLVVTLTVSPPQRHLARSCNLHADEVHALEGTVMSCEEREMVCRSSIADK